MDSLNQLNKVLLQGKKVLVRGDLDVPVADGKVVEGTRIESMRETLDFLTIRGAKVILMGHRGRPDGVARDEFSMKPVAEYLSSLGYPVVALKSIFGPELAENLKIMAEGEILLLENLRFDKREEANDESFAKDLASFASLYVNEAFSDCHRAHASIVGVPKHIKSVCGFNLQKETENLFQAVENSKSPVVTIFGGIKLETKLPAISKFLKIADYILLGGKLGLAYEGDTNQKILIPIDYVDEQLDIGPKTVAMFENVIKIAETIIWSGPMGKIEEKKYFSGTQKIAEAVAASKAFTVVGGGDTISALDKAGVKDKIKFVSTGGGAMLEFISGKRLPGLSALGYYGEKGY